MKRSPLKRRGKRTAKWENVRRSLKKEFEAKGIVRCEKCGSDNFLSFGHRLKRRFITTVEELKTVALLCVPCHQEIELSGHENMYNAINEIIEKREEIFI